MISNIKFSFTPIGGVGQIGSNITLVQHEDSCFLIDAGILFPHENFFDINYLIPNLDGISTEPQKIIITHGHEDHIGAIRHVVEKWPNIEIHAPLFAAELIKFKLREAKSEKKIHIYDRNTTLSMSGLLIHPIQVNHSIPDTYGLHLTCHQSKISVFFISDFKIDEKTPYEPYFDFDRLLKTSGSSRKKFLFCDSTNILSGTVNTPSEIDLEEDLHNLLLNDGRVFATFFASNIHRLQTFINLAVQTKRKCVLYGRSLLKYSSIALKEGLLSDPKNVIKSIDSVDYDDPRLLVLLTGCQGDFKGSFRRVCLGEDPKFKLTSDDTVIMSSKAIPGNEKNISLILNQVALKQCRIATPSNYHIHASGHPGRGDILTLIDKYKPHVIVPIHGEVLFLNEHISFLKSQRPDIATKLIYNFDTLNLITNEIERGEALDPLLIHGNGILIEKTAISQRRKLASSGVVFITLPLKNPNSLQLTMSGLPDIANSFTDELHRALINRAQSHKRDKVAEELRVLTRQFFEARLGYRPIAFIHLS